MPLSVFAGYDEREKDACDVCVSSLLRHATKPLDIVRLDHENLRSSGVYDRPYRTDGVQKIDLRDGRPFSTDFAFTRFLVPALSLFEGYAIFCDCDFLFTSDISLVLDGLDTSKAVHVVKHDQIVKSGTKMDGVSQVSYPRKNWSSFIVWNCQHPKNKTLSTKIVNEQSGRWLHGFSWLDDEDIGTLALTWNYLSDVSPPWAAPQPPKAIHYTLGVPSMKGHENCQFSELWTSELSRIRQPERTALINVAA